MKRFCAWFAVLILCVTLGMAGAVRADDTWLMPVPSGLTAGDMVYAKDGHTLSNKALTTTDSSVFLSAVDNCRVASGVAGEKAAYAWDGYRGGVLGWERASRVASSVWAYGRGGIASETYAMRCSLNSWLQRAGGTRGVKLTSLGIAYQILGPRQAGLNADGIASHYWGKLATLGYANAADVVQGLDLATTPTLATTARSTPYLSTVTVTTPAYLPAAANTELVMEWVITMSPNITYRLYGVNVNFTRLDH